MSSWMGKSLLGALQRGTRRHQVVLVNQHKPVPGTTPHNGVTKTLGKARIQSPVRGNEADGS
jgi:hypothetical protein